MEIFTSYYGNVKNVPEHFKLICISRTMPSWLDRSIIAIDEAKPSPALFKEHRAGLLSYEQFAKAYRDQIWWDLPDIFSQLTNRSVLLCWEASDEHCHRKILANELNRQYDLCIREF